MSAENTPSALRKYLFLALQITVSVGLLGWVLSGVDTGGLLSAIAGANPWYLLAALAVMPPHVLANAVRWQYVWPTPEQGGGTRPSLGTLTKLILVGMFFNQVLPAPVGGDAVRTIGAKRQGCNLSAAALSILIERTWGLIAVTLMILPSLPYLLPGLLPPVWSPATTAISLTVLAIIGLFITFFVFRWGSQKAEARFQKPLLVALTQQWRETTLRPLPATLLFVLSVLGQLPPIFAMVFIALALPGAMDPVSALMIAPLAIFATVIPLSFSGWGVRETIVVAALASQGVDGSHALALSLVFGLLLLILSLPGALMWASLRKSA